MRVACLCVVMGLLVSGCATTGDVEKMIDAKVSPQIKQINGQLDQQKVDAEVTLNDMKSFIDRLGRALDEDIKDVQTGVDGLEKQLNSMSDDLEAAQASIADLKKQDGNLKADGARDEADIRKMQDSLTSLSGKITSLQDAVKALEKARTDALAATVSSGKKK